MTEQTVRNAGGGQRPAAGWALALYVGAAILWTLPLAWHLADRIPHDPADPVLNTWIIWWNAQAAPFTSRWWSAPAFFPARDTMALSEHLVGLWPLTTPLQWAGASAVTAYNVAFLAAFVLAGHFTYLLCRHLTGRNDVAFVAGLMFAFSPYRWSQVAHLQSLASFWMPIGLLALHRYLQAGQLRWLVLFAAAWVLQALSNGYLLMFFSLVVAAWLLWFVRWRETPVPGLHILAAWGVGIAVVTPVLWSYRRVHQRLGLTRGFGEVSEFSADVLSIVTPPPGSRLWPAWHEWPNSEQYLFPGAVALILAAIGVVLYAKNNWATTDHGRASSMRNAALGAALLFGAAAAAVLLWGPWRVQMGALVISASGYQKPLAVALALLAVAACCSHLVRAAWRRRSVPAFYLLVSLALWTLSWGPRPRMFGHVVLHKGPYVLLMNLPGFDALRAPGRFGILISLLLVVSGSFVLARLTAIRRPWRTIVPPLAALLVLADGAVWPMPLAELPVRADLSWTPAESVVLDYPPGDVLHDAAALYAAMHHERLLVNGYSGHSPPHYRVLRRAVQEGDLDVLRVLARDVPLAISSVWSGVAELNAWARAQRDVRIDHAGSVGARYIIEPRAWTSPPVMPLLRPIHAAAGPASRSAPEMIDRDLTTTWHSEQPQQGTERVTLTLDRVAGIAGVRLAAGRFVEDYPRMLTIRVSSDGSRWTTVWEGRTAPLALEGSLRDPLGSRIVILVQPVDARFIQMEQSAREPAVYWSVAEVDVLLAPPGLAAIR